MTLTNKEDALAAALALAITAPSEETMRECLAMSEAIANSGMTLEQVEAAKARAEGLAKTFIDEVVKEGRSKTLDEMISADEMEGDQC